MGKARGRWLRRRGRGGRGMDLTPWRRGGEKKEEGEGRESICLLDPTAPAGRIRCHDASTLPPLQVGISTAVLQPHVPTLMHSAPPTSRDALDSCRFPVPFSLPPLACQALVPIQEKGLAPRRRANWASFVIASHSSSMTSLKPVLQQRQVGVGRECVEVSGTGDTKEAVVRDGRAGRRMRGWRERGLGGQRGEGGEDKGKARGRKEEGENGEAGRAHLKIWRVLAKS